MADANDIPPSGITPPSVYFNRKTLLRGTVAAASAATLAVVYRRLNGKSDVVVEAPKLAGLEAPAVSADLGAADGYRVDEAMTPLPSVTHYTNFYELTTDKDAVANKAKTFSTKGQAHAVGEVTVDG